MRAIVQRVSQASVAVDGETIGAIGRGLLVLAAVGRGDTQEDTTYMADKVLALRIFPDEQGRFDKSVSDIGGGILAVSQFTLYGDTRRGHRPSFTEAASPEEAAVEFSNFVERLRKSGLLVETGRFQAMMDVSLVNEGPVTIGLDSADRHRPRGSR